MTLSTLVPTADTAPYTSVIGLLATFSDGSQLQFSGALISPTEVLTAAHGVWQQGIGAAISVVAVPEGLPESDALAGTEAVFQSGVYAEDFHYNAVDDANDLLTAAATQQDYALVHFGTSLLGTASFQLAQGTLSATTAIRIAGFPDGGPEVTATGTVAPAFGLADLTGDVALDDGSSGGPIWTTSSGVPTIVGTVSTGGDAAAVTPSSVAQIDGWEAMDTSTLVNGSATSAVGGRLLTLTGSEGVLTSFGRDTIQADAGTGVVYAAGASVSVLGGSGALVVVGGTGSDTVRPGAGSSTLFGGIGGGVFDAGRGGGSDVVGGSGASTLVGGGAGDVLFGAVSAPTAATAGAGSEVIVGGGGPETLAGGSGSTVVFAGTGADTVTAYEALSGTLLVVGYRAGLDTLELDTASGGRVATVGGGYGSSFTFANGARVVLYGVDTPPTALVS